MTHTFEAPSIQRDRLWTEFEQICDCGGRLSGTESELAATALLKSLGSDATGVSPRIEPVPYSDWRATRSELVGPDGFSHSCHPLVRTAPTPVGGLEAEVIDLGRGTPEQFEAHRQEISGRIALVQHELMFAPATIHRRAKYRMALDAGAVGFLIAGPLSGSLVAGSSGRGDEAGIPAAGIAPDTAALLMRTSRGWPRIRLVITTEERPAVAENLIFDLPGQTGDRVVLSAHIDGHDLGESAIDNASGLAVALSAARHLAPHVRDCRRGLRLAFFNIEEWALSGSAAHVAGLTDAERRAVALNINLDSVAGGSRLTALTSGYARLEPFLLGCAEQAGVPLGLYRPFQTNSDHANFALVGIPAFRLVAGFGDPTAATAKVLTSADTRSSVKADELLTATTLAIAITATALQADPAETEGWRST